MRKGVLSTLSGAVASLALAAPALGQYVPETVVVRAGTVITAAGDAIPGGSIVIEDGEIILVGPAIEAPAGAKIIDATDETVMPGIIIPSTRVGLERQLRSGLNGDVLVASELYFDRLPNDLWMSNGITTVGYDASGSGIRGFGAAVRTAHPNEEYILNRRAYLSATFDSLTRDKSALRDAFAEARAAIEAEEEARAEWEAEQSKKQKAAEKAGTEEQPPEGDEPKDEDEEPENGGMPDPQPEEGDGNGDETESEGNTDEPEEFVPPEIDPALKPLVDLLRGKEGVQLLLELGNAATVEHLQDVLADVKVDGGGDLPTPLLLGTVDRLPSLAGGGGGLFGGLFSSNMEFVIDDLVAFDEILVAPAVMSRVGQTQRQMNLVAELERAGARLALKPEDDSMGTINDYRSSIAVLVKHGLDRDAAIRAITAVPAELLGIDDTVGTIEVGKEADIIFLSGDPLDPASRVTRVMIEGSIEWERDGDR